jgi:hypothetical protein
MINEPASGTEFTTLNFLGNLRTAQEARLFHNTKLTSAKHSNLLGQFISYEENELL